MPPDPSDAPREGGPPLSEHLAAELDALEAMLDPGAPPGDPPAPAPGAPPTPVPEGPSAGRPA